MNNSKQAAMRRRAATSPSSTCQDTTYSHTNLILKNEEFDHLIKNTTRTVYTIVTHLKKLQTNNTNISRQPMSFSLRAEIVPIDEYGVWFQTSS